MATLSALLQRLRPHVAPRRQSLELLSRRLSISMIVGLLALALAYRGPPQAGIKRDVHIEILRTKPAPIGLHGPLATSPEVPLSDATEFQGGTSAR